MQFVEVKRGEEPESDGTVYVTLEVSGNLVALYGSRSRGQVTENGSNRITLVELQLPEQTGDKPAVVVWAGEAERLGFDIIKR